MFSLFSCLRSHWLPHNHVGLLNIWLGLAAHPLAAFAAEPAVRHARQRCERLLARPGGLQRAAAHLDADARAPREAHELQVVALPALPELGRGEVAHELATRRAGRSCEKGLRGACEAVRQEDKGPEAV